MSKSKQTPVLGSGERKNEGKLRYDLVHPLAHEGMVDVLTFGAEKYSPRNWENGMPWSKIISSLKRHLSAIEKGEDFDAETGKLHADHLQCNAHFLSAYFRIYPQGDDRPHVTKIKAKIGLDIDEVICDWIGPWAKHWGFPTPTAWFFDYTIRDKFDVMRAEGTLNDFYLNLPPKCTPCDIPFEPHCYVTSRPVPTEVTQAWLKLHGFPLRPVITVGIGESKVDAIREAGVDIFVDDRYDNYEELNREGICCFLFDGPHNQRYDVGYKRIKSLKELKV